MSRAYIGIGGWTYEPWRGLFYPSDLPHARELHFASRAVTSIEINGTFYRMQSRDSFRRWADETPDGFIFSLKAHRVTTNRKKLAEAGPAIDRFLSSGIVELGDKLGPILWQFAPTKRFDAEDFAAFLDLLPERIEGRPLRHAVELRHESFANAEAVDLLRRRNVALCVADSPKYPCLADLTADFVYARLQSAQASRKTGYAPAALEQWGERIARWRAGADNEDLPHVASVPKRKAKPRDVFLYMIDGAKERAPAAAQALLKRLDTPGSARKLR